MGDFLKFTPSRNTSTLWWYFLPRIKNSYGTAGLIAGLYLRSGCDPFTGYENYSSGATLDMQTFVHDRKWFGLGKWKNWARKQSLYNLCRKAGTHVYDMSTQADFILDEFSGLTYGPVFRGLMEATSAEEAAYLVYDQYLDIKKRSDEKREICAELALEIYDTYGEQNELMAPVKYVTTDRKRVVVRGQKGKKIPFIRKRLGYLTPNEYYSFVSLSDDGKEYSLFFNDEIGYVRLNKANIVTRMEPLRSRS